MITPKEKARELIAKFAYQIREKEDQDGFIANINTTKKCALIVVKEILNINYPYHIVYSEYKDNVLTEYTQEYYWEQVKQEIEAL
jgi:hypothetical protein